MIKNKYQRQLERITRIFGLTIFLFDAFNSAYAGCKETTLVQLKKEAEKKGGAKLVFFSSWCPSCEDSIKNYKNDAKVIFIAAFDHERGANKVAERFKISDDKCVFDRDDLISKQLGIKGVPAEIELKS